MLRTPAEIKSLFAQRRRFLGTLRYYDNQSRPEGVKSPSTTALRNANKLLDLLEIEMTQNGLPFHGLAVCPVTEGGVSLELLSPTGGRLKTTMNNDGSAKVEAFDGNSVETEELSADALWSTLADVSRA